MVELSLDTIVCRPDITVIPSFDLSNSGYRFDDNINTFEISVYKLESSNINPYAQIEKLLSGFQNLTTDFETTAIGMIESIGGKLLDSVEHISRGDFGAWMRDNITNIFSDAVHVSKMADRGAIIRGNFITKWFFDIPQSLSDTWSHQYDTDELSVEEMIMRKAPVYLAAKALSSVATDKVQRITNLAFEVAKREGISPDTNIVTIYKGTDMRTFNFVMNIMPSNATHAEHIVKGLTYLKRYMTGTRGNHTIIQEHCFLVKFTNNKLQDYLTIDGVELNLIKLDIDMGTDGSMQLMDDGTPKHIQVTLVFQERRPMRKEGNWAPVKPKDFNDKTQDIKTGKEARATDGMGKFVDPRSLINSPYGIDVAKLPSNSIYKPQGVVQRAATGINNKLIKADEHNGVQTINREQEKSLGIQR